MVKTTSVSLRISLTDANDSPPQFLQKQYRAVIDEGSEKFEPPLKVEARDPDKSSKITYSLAQSNESGLFDIDADSGEITIAKISKSDVYSNLKAGTIELTVRASDGLFIDESLLSVNVRDVNNNAPVFLQDHYMASVSELVKPGLLIVTIIDLNRFAPQFVRPWSRTDPRYSIEMQEEQPVGATVCAFGATDEDNAIAGYAIEPPNPYFQIDNVTEKVLQQKDETVQHLSDVTQSRIVVDDIRYHVDASGHIRRECYDCSHSISEITKTRRERNSEPRVSDIDKVARVVTRPAIRASVGGRSIRARRRSHAAISRISHDRRRLPTAAAATSSARRNRNLCQDRSSTRTSARNGSSHRPTFTLLSVRQASS
ncbi:unnamed protein product [Trichogramma brassicae]|uniref:Cadherin domain-containing protein n=1 Tax=Trichogramma brassicae TaxID=86971 RepID=A0A6H5I6Y7_9HYME|nr:unnamed protein product [Trichogramma brassicae]